MGSSPDWTIISGKTKNLRGHIDHLLQKASINDTITFEAEGRTECIIAQALGHIFDAIPGFGTSDYRCRRCLFFATEGMTPKVMVILNSLGVGSKLANVQELTGE